MELKLKNIRKSHGLTQGELAKEIYSTLRKVSAWERGETPIPLDDAIVIADFFSISLDELAGREPPEYPNYDDPRQLAINRIYATMNEAGKTKAADNIRDLAGNPAYQAGSKSDPAAHQIGA